MDTFVGVVNELDTFLKSNGEKGIKNNAENLQNANFNLDNKDIDGLLVGNCEINNATLTNIYWGGAYITNSKFNLVVFKNIDFRKAEFYSSIFLNCIFSSCKFIGASIQTSNFQNTIFDNCDFTNTIIEGNDFSITILANIVIILTLKIIEASCAAMTIRALKFESKYINQRLDDKYGSKTSLKRIELVQL